MPLGDLGGFLEVLEVLEAWRLIVVVELWL